MTFWPLPPEAPGDAPDVPAVPFIVESALADDTGMPAASNAAAVAAARRAARDLEERFLLATEFTEAPEII